MGATKRAARVSIPKNIYDVKKLEKQLADIGVKNTNAFIAGVQNPGYIADLLSKKGVPAKMQKLVEKGVINEANFQRMFLQLYFAPETAAARAMELLDRNLINAKDFSDVLSRFNYKEQAAKDTERLLEEGKVDSSSFTAVADAFKERAQPDAKKALDLLIKGEIKASDFEEVRERLKYQEPIEEFTESFYLLKKGRIKPEDLEKVKENLKKRKPIDEFLIKK